MLLHNIMHVFVSHLPWWWASCLKLSKLMSFEQNVSVNTLWILSCEWCWFWISWGLCRNEFILNETIKINNNKDDKISEVLHYNLPSPLYILVLKYQLETGDVLYNPHTTVTEFWHFFTARFCWWLLLKMKK